MDENKFEIIALNNEMFAKHELNNTSIIKNIIVYPYQCEKHADGTCALSQKQCKNPVVFPKHCTLEKFRKFRLYPVNISNIVEQVEKRRKDLQERLSGKNE